jgi:hypothetical protein
MSHGEKISNREVATAYCLAEQSDPEISLMRCGMSVAITPQPSSIILF